jgi:AcrR family transcriptional regulator
LVIDVSLFKDCHNPCLDVIIAAVSQSESPPPKRRYSSALRESQAEITQRRIMEAMADVVAGAGADKVTHATVARAAQVAERTLYRHYPTKDALWDAFLEWVSELVGLTQFPDNEHELIDLVPAMFSKFDEHDSLLRSCLSSRAWSEVWIRGRQGWRDSVQHAVQNGDGVDGDKARLIGAVIQLLFSGIAWKALKDHSGLPGEDVSRAAMLSIKALLKELHS